ncbi:VOC family protein [Tumebacillus flagellatus]|uniref:Glyoxalase n=1 Tax=Tumebacillus flagellatus TaxID=1157490 RepID=A0A074LHI4_9BACL|nr:VOC family protein [Tumebacillus flagellatus]KEO81676.1 glyoxalase [Tumebacillus flagellatus]
MIYGLYEAHLHVTNLERAAEFYEKVLGLKLGHHEEKRRANFYFFDENKNHMLGVWEIAPEQFRREHVAFHSTVEDIKRAAAFFDEHGIETRNFDNTGKTPLKVIAWMPAISIFFKDPDGHSLEMLAMLPDEPKPELGVVPWAEWEAMHGRELT